MKSHYDRRTPTCDRRTFLRVGGPTLAAVTTVGIAGCLRGESGSTRTVKMTADLGFEPETATVEARTTVRWTNESDVKHTVTAYENRIPDGAAYFASGGFDSEQAARANLSEGLLAEGEAYEHAFEQSGTYEYYCIPHEGSGMVGTVRVE
jgi:plastocyanin